MDFEQNMYTQTPYQNTRSEGMAMASVILGVAALLTSCCIYVALPCGALGIILALLSRGGHMTMSSQAKLGLILSAVGLALTILIIVVSFVFVFSYYGGMDGLMQEYMNIYNVDSLEELYESMGTGTF